MLPWDPKQIPQDTRDYVITQFFTDQGLIGTSMDGDYQLRPGIAAEVQKHAEAYFIGKDPFDLEAHQANFFLKAKSPVRLWYLEIALWDIIGKACGQPLFKLWGANASKVKPYAATVHFLKSPEQRAEDAQRFYEQGFRAIKLRQHSLRMEDDLRMARTVIDAVRGRMDVMVDANQAGKRPSDPPPVWDVQRAIDTARALEDMGLYWLEEPLPRNDFAGLAKVRASLKRMYLAGGEGNIGLPDFARSSPAAPSPTSSPTPSRAAPSPCFAKCAAWPRPSTSPSARTTARAASACSPASTSSAPSPTPATSNT